MAQNPEDDLPTPPPAPPDLPAAQDGESTAEYLQRLAVYGAAVNDHAVLEAAYAVRLGEWIIGRASGAGA